MVSIPVLVCVGCRQITMPPRTSKRKHDGTPESYGAVKIISQPKSILKGTDLCIATGKPIPLLAGKCVD